MDSLNKELQNKAHKLIPGGCHTYSRGDDQFPLNAPPIISRAKGVYVWDAEDHQFLDYNMALRAVTVGYAYPEIAEGAIAEIWKGNLLPRASVTEVKAAETLVDVLGWPEMVKFGKNGSTVTSAAIKLARAYTGRPIIARCLQHPFFSYDDWFIVDTAMNRGIPDSLAPLTVNFNYNDEASLQKLFDQYPGQIAAVILEPATTEAPKVYADGRNFLHAVGDICRKNDAVYILDEMITGFRWHVQGAAQVYNVVPDLATYGKGMGNGFSVAALAGKKEIMRLGSIDHDQQRVFLISTTHGAEMSGLGGFLATMKVYREHDVVGHLARYGKKLKTGMDDIARELGIEKQFSMGGMDCMPSYTTADRDGKVSLELRTLFSQELIARGVMMPWISISFSHGETELQKTLEATRGALQVYRNALEEGVSKYLRGPAIKPVFRKFN